MDDRQVMRRIIKITLIFNAFASWANIYSSDSTPYSSIYNYTNSYYEKLNKNRSVIEDKRGLLYIGNDNGVIEYDGVSWRLITLPELKQVYSLGIDTSGRVYVGGNGEFGYLGANHEGKMVYKSLLGTLGEKYNKFRDNINKIRFASNEIYFIGDKLLFIVNRHEAPVVTKVVQASDFFYSSICINNQLILCDGEAGLVKLVSDRLTPVPYGESVLSYVMLQYNSHKILIVTPDKGIILYDMNSSQENRYAFSQFPLYDHLTTFDIKSGCVVKPGLFALGSVRNGCTIIDTSGIIKTSINNTNGLQNNVVYDIQKDADGKILLGLDQGISIFSLANKDTINEKSEFKSFVRRFSGRESDTSYFHGTFFSTNMIPILTQPEAQLLKFKYSINSFRFSYASNYYINPDSTVYQIFLQGLDTGWGEWSDRTYCEYTNLNRGKYVFRVRAKNIDGEISKEGRYTFQIMDPWFKSWWFYAAQIGTLLLFLLVSTYLYKIGKVEKLAGNLTGIVAVIGFEYLNLAISPFLERLATGIAIFDMIINIVIANVVSPVQNFTNKLMEIIVKGPYKKKETYYVDNISKAYNSTYIQEFLEKEIARVERYGKDLSCIMIDIKNLDELTDRNGRGIKKTILRQFAALVKCATRKADVFGRLNDKLFLLVLPETSTDNANVVAEKIKSIITQTKFIYKKKEVPVRIRTKLTDVNCVRKTSVEEIIKSSIENLNQS